jgi:hypothetical protein
VNSFPFREDWAVSGDKNMYESVKLASNVAGFFGMAICLCAGVFRMTGQYHVAGFEAMTLFAGGMGLMVAACFMKLFLMSR